MNPPLKRYRQASIIECFGLLKKPKADNLKMSNRTEIRNLMLNAAENRISSTSIPEVSRNLSQFAIKDSKISNDDVNLKTCALNVESKMERIDNMIDTDTYARTELTTKDDVNLNSPDEESGFENSAELFADDPSSLEDDFIPSSAELFTEQDDSGSLQGSTDDDDSNELEEVSFLNKIPDCCIPLPRLEPLENHSIMFSPYVRPGDAPRPYPPIYKDRWDSESVRMPCSPMNKYPIEDRYGEKIIESRWSLICQSLNKEIGSSDDLVAAILRYNSQYAEKWNFQGLHAFINKHLEEEEQDYFFETMLPAMIKIALNLPKICTQAIPLLKKNKDHYITISQKQIGCLLLNAFFCTFPRRNMPHKRYRQRMTSEYSTYPDINFNRLFAGVKNEISSRNAEKLKCLFNYFRRITSEEPTGVVTFHRQCLLTADIPKWHESTRGIKTAIIRSSGVIETDGYGMLQVDFANKYVGGGVLGQGCVQEEIRFIICPELIVSRLFVECLDYNEALIITGVEQYSKYSGYADSFKFEGDFRDNTQRDSWGRKYTQLVAMDATNFRNPSEQFKSQFIKKELNKAYCGFYENSLPSNLPAVATGNWGCGAFKGNPNLKFLIQLMAASETGRSLLYFTFGNKKLKIELQNMYNFLIEQNLAVGDVWRLLMNYSENVSLFSKAKYSKLYDFIFYQFLNKEENCRQEENEIEGTSTIHHKFKLAAVTFNEGISCDSSSTEIEDVYN